MSSQELQENFEFIAQYLFLYLEKNNFLSSTPRVRKKRIAYIKCLFIFFLKNATDTLLLAAHHNHRAFSFDLFYYNFRFATDFNLGRMLRTPYMDTEIYDRLRPWLFGLGREMEIKQP
jgi:hypothetical protein